MIGGGHREDLFHIGISPLAFKKRKVISVSLIFSVFQVLLTQNSQYVKAVYFRHALNSFAFTRRRKLLSPCQSPNLGSSNQRKLRFSPLCNCFAVFYSQWNSVKMEQYYGNTSCVVINDFVAPIVPLTHHDGKMYLFSKERNYPSHQYWCDSCSFFLSSSFPFFPPPLHFVLPSFPFR